MTQVDRYINGEAWKARDQWEVGLDRQKSENLVETGDGKMSLDASHWPDHQRSCPRLCHLNVLSRLRRSLGCRTRGVTHECIQLFVEIFGGLGSLRLTSPPSTLRFRANRAYTTWGTTSTCRGIPRKYESFNIMKDRGLAEWRTLSWLKCWQRLHPHHLLPSIPVQEEGVSLSYSRAREARWLTSWVVLAVLVRTWPRVVDLINRATVS